MFIQYYLNEYNTDELLSWVLLTVTMTLLYGKLTQEAIAKNRFLQESISILMSEAIVFLDKIHSFWRAAHETIGQSETPTH